MLKHILFFGFAFWSVFLFAQGKVISVSAEADVKGGKEALQQVLETQLTLPKLLLTKDFSKEVIVYFELDSLDRAKAVTFNQGLNNLLALEIKRVLKFLRFNRKTAVSDTPYEYYLTLQLSTEKYNKYIKQKTKAFVKNDKSSDSTYVVYTRADRSPDYFKGGEEGLTEFVIGQLQYPDIAREKSIQGTVILDFVVETNGFVTNIEVKQGVSGGCTEEALRIIKLTRWQPAVLNNKYVRYKLTYPITFTLENNFKDNTSPRQGSGF
jgi:TonB family protein